MEWGNMIGGRMATGLGIFLGVPNNCNDLGKWSFEALTPVNLNPRMTRLVAMASDFGKIRFQVILVEITVVYKRHRPVYESMQTSTFVHIGAVSSSDGALGT
jgi:hypothetical protein